MTDPMAPVKLPVYNDKKEIVEQAYVSQCDVARVEKGTLYWRFCHVAIQIRGKRMRLTHFIRGSPEPGWIVNFIDKNPLNHQRRNMFVEKDSEMRGVHKCGNHFHALMPDILPEDWVVAKGQVVVLTQTSAYATETISFWEITEVTDTQLTLKERNRHMVSEESAGDWGDYDTSEWEPAEGFQTRELHLRHRNHTQPSSQSTRPEKSTSKKHQRRKKWQLYTPGRTYLECIYVGEGVSGEDDS